MLSFLCTPAHQFCVLRAACRWMETHVQTGIQDGGAGGRLSANFQVILQFLLMPCFHDGLAHYGHRYV